MKFGNKITERWSLSYKRTGRKKGYKAEVTYNSFYNRFYFMLEKEDYIFNSLWKNMEYVTEQECIDTCEKYIDDLVKDGGKHE